MNKPVTFDQLDAMAAEVLPERTVLGVVVTPGGGASGSSSSAAAAGSSASSAGGGIALSACTTTNTLTNPGVLGLLGPQVFQGPIHTMSCVPAAVATY